MLNWSFLKIIIDRLQWVPIVDVCCCRAGANAISPLYYCVGVDSTLQAWYLAGLDWWCNPPFKKVFEFIQLAESAFKMNKNTRVALMAPRRPNSKFYKYLMESKDW